VAARERWDPRLYQIGTLTGLLVYGVGWLDFDVDPAGLAAIVATALATQMLATRFFGLPRFDPKSALISALSLCLLLRSDSPALMAATAALTIASKFVLKWNGKHLFNPTNIGLVAMMAFTGRVWVSPGQWGSAALAGFLMACLGIVVVSRARRGDVTWAFLGFYVAALVGRALWLGDPFAIPLHQLQSGALLLFAFFMISDPKTTPDSRAGRILFAFLVASGAIFVRFVLFRQNGVLWSLAVAALAVPLIDRLLPGDRYEWRGRAATGTATSVKGVPHETALDRVPALRVCRAAGALGVGVLRLLRREGRHQALQSRVAGRARP
jgi:Na+-transporting NADH:ubiquinone oxidoreductase subunit NqrB